jgi:hypothetical protein
LEVLVQLSSSMVCDFMASVPVVDAKKGQGLLLSKD